MAEERIPEDGEAAGALLADFEGGEFAGLMARLEAGVGALPPGEFLVRHLWLPGMVLRQMFAPAGSVIVGWVHKKASFAGVSSGRILVRNQRGLFNLGAGDVFVSEPGTQNAGLTLEDTTYFNVWRTELAEDEVSEDAVRHDVAVPSLADYERLLLQEG